MKKIVILFILATLVFLPAYSADKSEGTPSRIVVQADPLIVDLETQDFEAQSSARVQYRDVVLTADKVLGNFSTGDVEATGNVVFRSQDRTLTGNSFSYNFRTENGIARDMKGSASGVYFIGKEMKSEPERYTLKGSRLTSCDRERPHYYLAAGEVMVVPDKELIARDVTVVLYGQRLFKLPRFRVNLDEDKKKKRSLPPLLYSSDYGLNIGREINLSDTPDTIGNVDVRLSTKQLLNGGVVYDKIDGKPIFARAMYSMPHYGGTRPGIRVSKLPEVGLRYSTGATAGSLDIRAPLELFSGFRSGLSEIKRPGEMNAAGEIGLGYFIEHPDDVSSLRADARALVWLNPIPLDSRTTVSPGVYARYSAYDHGEDYSVLGYRVSLTRKFGEDVEGELTYGRRKTYGSTPFNFDRNELSNELSGKVIFPLAGLTLEVGGRYDVNNGTMFDSEYAVSKRIHCLEPRIGWRTRYKELTLGISLVGF